MRLAGALEDVAQALGLKELSNRPSQVTRESVRRLTGTRGLLVANESQHLNLQALERMRVLHDAARIGLVLCGNEAACSRLTGFTQPKLFDIRRSTLEAAGVVT
jgi:DNA transposition AAA+ family ATPase